MVVKYVKMLNKVKIKAKANDDADDDDRWMTKAMIKVSDDDIFDQNRFHYSISIRI